MKTTLILFLLLAGGSAFGQRTITGRVVDEKTKKPIVGAVVRLFPSTTKATTNALGYFQLTVSNLDSLIVKSPGYATSMLKIPEKDSFQISLKAVEK